MAKTEWGMKRTCLSCGARFYDLNNTDIVCPKCATVFDPEAAVKLKKGRNLPVEAKSASPAKEDDDLLGLDDDSDDALDNTDDEDVLEDTSDLDDDDVVVSRPSGENSDDQ